MKYFGPVVPAPGSESSGQIFFEFGPFFSVELHVKCRYPAIEAESGGYCFHETFKKGFKESRLEASDRHPLTVLTCVDIIKRSAAIKKSRSTRTIKRPRGRRKQPQKGE